MAANYTCSWRLCLHVFSARPLRIRCGNPAQDQSAHGLHGVHGVFPIVNFVYSFKNPMAIGQKQQQVVELREVRESPFHIRDDPNAGINPTGPFAYGALRLSKPFPRTLQG